MFVKQLTFYGAGYWKWSGVSEIKEIKPNLNLDSPNQTKMDFNTQRYPTLPLGGVS